MHLLTLRNQKLFASTKQTKDGDESQTYRTSVSSDLKALYKSVILLLLVLLLNKKIYDLQFIHSFAFGTGVADTALSVYIALKCMI